MSWSPVKMLWPQTKDLWKRSRRRHIYDEIDLVNSLADLRNKKLPTAFVGGGRRQAKLEC
jgi:hypothetical protein